VNSEGCSIVIAPNYPVALVDDDFTPVSWDLCSICKKNSIVKIKNLNVKYVCEDCEAQLGDSQTIHYPRELQLLIEKLLELKLYEQYIDFEILRKIASRFSALNRNR